MTSATETILLSLENPTSQEVLVLAFNVQCEVGIHHVLEHVGTCHGTRLGDLPDDDGIDEVCLAVVGDRRQRPLSTFRVHLVCSVLPIIQGLQGVHDQEEGLLRIGRSNLVTVVQKVRHHDILPGDETVSKPEPLHRHLELE